jgi:hypothetical protein
LTSLMGFAALYPSYEFKREEHDNAPRRQNRP